MDPNYSIAIVDDDPAVSDSLMLLLEAADYETTIYNSGDIFLNNDVRSMKGCVLLDVRMPGKDGLTVLQDAKKKNPNLMFIMMSGHGDIPMAVKALKLGAEDFIEKPFLAEKLLSVIEKTYQKINKQTDKEYLVVNAQSLLSTLTPRELEIAEKLSNGKANKIVAFELGISIRTVETHRSRIMSKLGIRSLADLVKIYLNGTQTL